MGHTLGNDVEAEECTVYFEMSQKSHVGSCRKVIGHEIEHLFVLVFTLLKKINKAENLIQLLATRGIDNI